MQWSQYMVLIVAFGAPAASWLFNKLREQYEKKRQADMRRVREEESIRVQRTAERLDVPPPQTQAQRRIEELAARRQAQLEELRKRRAAAAGRPTTPEQRPAVVLAPPTPPVQAPHQGPMRPGVPGAPQRSPGPMTPPIARPAGPPRPGVPQQSGPRPGRPLPSGAPSRPRGPQVNPAHAPVGGAVASIQQAARATTVRTPPQTAAAPMRTIAPRRATTTEAITPGTAARAMLMGRTGNPSMTAATAFALTEILSKPVALRDAPDR